jgi:uncharacterized protein
MSEAAEADLGERTCIVSREVKAESELVRFVRSPEGRAVPDLKRNLPGRGVWVSLNRALVEEAQRKGLFSRGFGAKTEADPELANLVGGLLRKAALSYISLAKKAGLAVAGREKVEASLRKKACRVLLHAAEAAADGKRQLDRLAQAQTVIINLFGVDELDLAFGRSNVVHAALEHGALTEHVVKAAARLEAYEGRAPANVERT